MSKPINTANRFGLDYVEEAATFPRLDFPIIDAHTHINGDRASALYGRAAELYGIGLTYSMTAYRSLEVVKRNLGDRVRFIAVPDFAATDRAHEHSQGFIERLPQFYEKGARIVKFWSAPRGVDLGRQVGQPDLLRIDAPHRIEAMKVAHDLGMVFMAHIADPDTWFQTKYADASVYGTKREQYERFERVLSRFDNPWIGAHMGGWPEDLDFLSGLLARHPHLYLDFSATKWIVREVSKYSSSELVDFLRRWSGRIMFGSDIISIDEHLGHGADNEMAKKASNEDEAFDLYASRYWALRTLLERDYDGESPIADPDLHLVDPQRYTETDAPPLRGKHLPPDILRTLYYEAAHALLEPLYA